MELTKEKEWNVLAIKQVVKYAALKFTLSVLMGVNDRRNFYKASCFAWI